MRMVVQAGQEQRNIHSLATADFNVISLQQPSADFHHHSSPHLLALLLLSQHLQAYWQPYVQWVMELEVRRQEGRGDEEKKFSLGPFTGSHLPPR